MVTLRISDDDLQRLDELAEDLTDAGHHEVTRSDVIRDAITQYLTRMETK